jgi:hypothetical protein
MPKPLVIIKERSWIARLAAWKLGAPAVALTLGDTIYLYNANAAMLVCDAGWLRHELKHVEQFRRYGLTRFLAMYAWESLKKGYQMNRFEVEARAAEGSSENSRSPFHLSEGQGLLLTASHV